MVSIWKTFRSMRDGRCRESGRSSEARCREVPLYTLINSNSGFVGALLLL